MHTNNTRFGKIQSTLKNFYTQFSNVEKLLLLLNFIGCVGIFIFDLISSSKRMDYFGATFSFIGSTTNAICGMLIAMKKISNYYFGIVSVILVGLVSYHNSNIGNFFLNVFYIPMQFLGIFLGKKHINPETQKISHRPLNKWIYISVFSMVAVFSGVLTYVESLPIFYHFGFGKGYEPSDNEILRGTKFASDGSSLIMSVVAMVLLLMRNKTQYILWVIVEALEVILGIITLIAIPEEKISSIPMIGMHLMSLITCIYGAIMWYRKK